MWQALKNLKESMSEQRIQRAKRVIAMGWLMGLVGAIVYFCWHDSTALTASLAGAGFGVTMWAIATVFPSKT
jgi:hypothetical protein